MDLQGRVLHSGELAAMAGVSTDTLRHYERKGLLPPAPRSVNGYRVYGVEALDRIRLIRTALHLGFSISELTQVLRVRSAGGIPCQNVRNLAADKLRKLRERKRELTQMIAMLGKVIHDWDRRLRNSKGRPAHLLQSLASNESGGHFAPPFSSPRRRNSKRGNKA
jgi:DNA-binding transcriptional MerR regulator